MESQSKALWRSWLARRPVTAEVAGSSPVRVAIAARHVRAFRPGSSVGMSVRLKSGRSAVRSRPWPPRSVQVRSLHHSYVSVSSVAARRPWGQNGANLGAVVQLLSCSRAPCNVWSLYAPRQRHHPVLASAAGRGLLRTDIAVLKVVEGVECRGDVIELVVNSETKKRNHIRQLEALGYNVTLSPAA